MIRHNGSVRISAKVDYGMRALLQLADSDATRPGEYLKAEQIAEAEDIPLKFLEGILRQLRLADLVTTRRGSEGGYQLSHSAESISVADVIRALDGPLADVRGFKPEDLIYEGASENLGEIWIALRAAMREVLEKSSIEDVRKGTFNEHLRVLNSNPEARKRR